MKFSIIVPIYNVEKYLDDCVKSILNQKFRDFELILVDDGSPDKCGEMCDGYAKGDSRIKVIHKPNGGLADARNAGLDAANGEYIIFIDSDDGMEGDSALDIINNAIDKYKNPDILIKNTWGNYGINCKDTQELLSFLIKLGFREKKFSLVAWDKVYKTQYINDNNFRFKKGYIHEDLLWTFIVLANAKSFGIVDEEFYKRNIVEESLSRNPSEMGIFRRATSKLNVTKIGTDYFHNGNFTDSVRADVYEFYIGIYTNGITEGMRLKEKDNIDKFYNEYYKTSDIFKYGKYTTNKKYKLISLIYGVFGPKAIITYLKRR